MSFDNELPAGVALTSLDKFMGLNRKASVWPVTMGLACCAIEMMATGTPRFDISRFGMEVFRASPACRSDDCIGQGFLEDGADYPQLLRCHAGA